MQRAFWRFQSALFAAFLFVRQGWRTPDVREAQDYLEGFCNVVRVENQNEQSMALGEGMSYFGLDLDNE